MVGLTNAKLRHHSPRISKTSKERVNSDALKHKERCLECNERPMQNNNYVK